MWCVWGHSERRAGASQCLVEQSSLWYECVASARAEFSHDHSASSATLNYLQIPDCVTLSCHTLEETSVSSINFSTPPTSSSSPSLPLDCCDSSSCLSLCFWLYNIESVQLSCSPTVCKLVEVWCQVFVHYYLKYLPQRLRYWRCWYVWNCWMKGGTSKPL